MNTTTKRTSLKAVYLTDTERDLVRMAFATLLGDLGANNLNSTTAFARSYTAKRIAECSSLFSDKPTGSAT